MSKNTHVTITVLDPERWYLKFSEKRKHYVQLHASYWLDSDFCSLELPTKTTFLWILSQCLRVNKPSVSICLESACMFLRVPLGTCKGMLRELKASNIIDMERHLRSQLIEKNKKEEKRIEAKTDFNKSDSLVSEVLDLWNRNAISHGMPKVKTLSSARIKKLQTALKSFSDIEDWKKIFTVASTKGFTKKDSTPFVPNWDYIFRNENYIKFSEEHDLMLSGDNIPETTESLVKDVEDILMSQMG